MHIKSPIIRNLYEQLEKNEHQALDEFWQYVEKRGTPLIEEDVNNKNQQWLTFIWRSASHSNVVVAFYSMAKKRMIRLPDSDVWYLTLSVPANFRTIYCISPQDHLNFIEENNFFDKESLKDFCFSWQVDQLNPKTYKMPAYLTGSVGGKEMFYSLIDMGSTTTWSTPSDNVPSGTLDTHYLYSDMLDNERKIRVYLPANFKKIQNKIQYLLIVFDGDAYTDVIPTPTILNNLIDSEAIPPMAAVFISNPEPNVVTRSMELPCNPDFSSCVANEILPWVLKKYPIQHDPAKTIIAGSSFGGLAAAYLGLTNPNLFGNIISQSGAFWWSPKNDSQTCWLINQYRAKERLPLRFYLDCGFIENFQFSMKGDSTQSAIRHFRDILFTKHYDVHYEEFSGGHDYICWKESLANGLIILAKKMIDS